MDDGCQWFLSFFAIERVCRHRDHGSVAEPHVGRRRIGQTIEGCSSRGGTRGSKARWSSELLCLRSPGKGCRSSRHPQRRLPSGEIPPAPTELYYGAPRRHFVTTARSSRVQLLIELHIHGAAVSRSATATLVLLAQRWPPIRPQISSPATTSPPLHHHQHLWLFHSSSSSGSPGVFVVLIFIYILSIGFSQES